jgi:ADP-ribose pyrophosphatase
VRHGPWEIIESREVYRDPWIAVRRDEVLRPDLQPGSHCVVALKPGISVLAIDAAQHVQLTEEFHYAVGRVTWEVVSGGIEAGEAALTTAQRELAEELGIAAARWTAWGMLDPITSVVVSPTALFLAEELSGVPRALEPTELITPLRMPLVEALAAVVDGRITHAPSCVLLMRAAMHFGVSLSSVASSMGPVCPSK